MSANLILHWMLDTLDEGNIADETDNHLNGTIIGDIQVVPDAKFGSCLSFDGNGDSITTPDTSTLRLDKYTAEVWIKPEETTNNWQGVLGKPGRNYNIWIGAENVENQKKGYIHHSFHAGTNNNAAPCNTDIGSIVWGKWHHVAITNDGQTARTYINGILKAEGLVAGELGKTNNQFIVGRDLDGGQGLYYKGRMAHVRLYDDVLTLEEIRRDMLQDESAPSAFVRSHPIDFELYNEDNHHILFIDNHPEGQTLSLDIINSSRQNIELKDIGQTATPRDYHFELRFRPETLASVNVPKINIATDGWSIDRAPDGTALYLLHRGSMTLKSGQRISLQLTEVNADGRGGTRGTRVELVYTNIQYAGEVSLLKGSRLQYLNIVNRQGRRNIPLHVGFVGSDTVLSDGKTANTLRLRIANLSRDSGLRLTKGNSTTPSSRFRVSFDVQTEGENREWALTNASGGNGASLQVSQSHRAGSNWAAPEKKNLGQSVEWIVTPAQDTTLEADGYIILELSSLIALPSIGHANIYINFENIPGYEDEQMTVVVQKSPLLFSNSNIGIGTTNPEAKLQIIDSNQDANGKTLIIGPTNQSNLRLGYHENYSWIQSHGSKPLAINPVGNNVGIGTSTPTEKLEVSGKVKAEGFVFSDGTTLLTAPPTASRIRIQSGSESIRAANLSSPDRQNIRFASRSITLTGFNSPPTVIAMLSATDKSCLCYAEVEKVTVTKFTLVIYAVDGVPSRDIIATWLAYSS